VRFFNIVWCLFFNMACLHYLRAEATTMETNRTTMERATRKEEIETIFKACNASLSGDLEIFEAQFGLQALGLIIS